MGYYFLAFFKSLFSCCKCGPEMERTQTYVDCSEEMSHQLDITYIMRRLIFMDAAISKLLEKH